ncbi:septum site-determining protein Ssd [Streptomyces lavendofoliae]|uniref:septum site-determining protein Ssd n=1 Tax=Streptomyces lavendofoliae TaxID=67314 RepID=UPI003D89B38D
MAGSITSDRVADTGKRRSGPLIVTEDAELLDDLLRLCAAAGAHPQVHHALPEHRASWDAAPLVLVGDDAAARCRGATRRRDVLLVGRDQEDPGVWRRAVEIGADRVLRLPEAESWLVDRIADVVEGSGRQALTVGVLAGRGGAGASTLACALAVTAAREGRRTMLVDADPLGGGLDVLLGGEQAEGLRWPDLAASKGRVAGGALEEALPSPPGMPDLKFLSWDRGGTVAVRPEAMRSVLAAARRRGGVVVVDLPRRVDDVTREALAQLDLGLLVVPAELRAVAGAQRVAAAVGTVLRELRVVVRGPYAAGVEDPWIARVLGLPLVGELPLEPGLMAASDADSPPGAGARSPLARFCAAFWERALAEESTS